MIDHDWCGSCGGDKSICRCKEKHVARLLKDKEKVMSDGTYDSLGKSAESSGPKIMSKELLTEGKLASPYTVSRSGELSVSKMYRKSAILGTEEISEELLDVKTFVTVPAEVDYSVRMTLNLGNFESVQVGVSCKLPCYVEEVEDAYIQAKKFVDAKLAKETAEIREYRKSKGKE